MLGARFALAAAAALAGCAGPTTSDISMSDRGVFLPSGRVGIDIAPRGDAPARPHTGHAIELGASGGKGEDRQAIGAGSNPVVFGGQTFNAPAELRHEFDFRFAELGYRYRRFFGDGSFGIEALGGLGYAELDLTVESGAQRAGEKINSGGLVGAFGIVWKFLPATSLQSRLTVFGSGEEEGVTAAARYDLYVAQALGRHAELRAGFASWWVRSEREADDYSVSRNSQIRARFSGPSLGLGLAF
jgi:hypothetical protein